MSTTFGNSARYRPPPGVSRSRRDLLLMAREFHNGHVSEAMRLLRNYFIDNPEHLHDDKYLVTYQDEQ